MPRGIVFDRYDVPQFRGETVRNPTPPADTTAADILTGIGKAAAAAGQNLTTAREKAEALSESIKVDERYLQAAGEIDEQLINISQDPPSREIADTVFGDWRKSRADAWSKGLTPEGNAALQKRLTEKTLSAQHQSRMIRVTDLGHRAEKNILVHERVFSEDYSRRTDDAPWTDATAPESYKTLRTIYGRAVAAGAMTQAQMDKGLTAAKKEASAVRAHALMMGDETDVNRLKLLLATEKEKSGSTWLSQIDAPTRAALEKQAKDVDHTLYTRRRQENEDRRLADERALSKARESWQTSAEQKLDEGSLSLAFILSGENSGLVSPEAGRLYRKALETKTLNGTDDATTRDRLARVVWSVTSDPAKVLEEVNDARTNGKLSHDTAKGYLVHLEGRMKDRDTKGRSEQEQALNKERGDVEGLIKTLTTTRSITEQFDPIANAYELVLKERLAKLPRNESALVWWEKNRAQFVSYMAEKSDAVARGQEALMAVKPVRVNPKDVLTEDSLGDISEYQKRFGSDARLKMKQDLGKLQEIVKLRQYSETIKQTGRKTDGTPGPQPSAASPSSRSPLPR